MVPCAGEAIIGLWRGACNEINTGNSEVAGSIPASGLNTLDSEAEYLGDIEEKTGRYRQGVYAALGYR
jgi:hypothetical protein